MARVQLVLRDEDRSRYIHQTNKEGLTLSAWLRAAAEERLERNSRVQPFESVTDLKAFFTECDKRDSGGIEPDWEQHISAINEVRKRGAVGS